MDRWAAGAYGFVVFLPNVGFRRHFGVLMIKKNITYGLIVLIPIAIIVLLLAKIVEVLKSIGEPLGLQSLMTTALAIAVAILLLLALCFVVRAVVRSRRIGLSFEQTSEAYRESVEGDFTGRVIRVWGGLPLRPE
jgi:hypothetical protein